MQPRREGERLGCLKALCTAFRCTCSPARGCSSPHLSCETPDRSPQAFVLPVGAVRVCFAAGPTNCTKVRRGCCPLLTEVRCVSNNCKQRSTDVAC